jgi:hypothetical protein
VPKTRKITAVQGYSRMTDEDVVLRGTALVTNMTGNPRYPKPPVSLAVLKAAIDRLSALIAGALEGSRSVIAEKKRQREEVIKLIRLVTRYVEVTCDGDREIFKSSGLELAYTTRRPTQHLSKNIRRIIRGDNSGTLSIFVNAVPEASSYQLRYAVLARGKKPGAWTTVAFANVKSAIVITGLKPATNYAFQVRTLLKTGYTDWSDSVTFICT